MPFNLGVPELLIIMVIIVLIFGVGKLPEVGGALGKGIREFRKESTIPDSDSTKGKIAAPDHPQQAAAVASQPASTNICPSCHAENPLSNTFCGKCGGKLG